MNYILQIRSKCRQGGSKNPKILRTSYLEALLLSSPSERTGDRPEREKRRLGPLQLRPRLQLGRIWRDTVAASLPLPTSPTARRRRRQTDRDRGLATALPLSRSCFLARCWIRRQIRFREERESDSPVAVKHARNSAEVQRSGYFYSCRVPRARKHHATD